MFDVSNPFWPEEVAYYVLAAPRGSRAGAVQINDVFVDERGIAYAVNRTTGGLYVLGNDAVAPTEQVRVASGRRRGRPTSAQRARPGLPAGTA